MDMKDKYTEAFLKAAGILADPDAIKKHRVKWWTNIRSKDTGLRLTEAGLDFVRDCANIRIYEISALEELALTPQVLLWMDEFLESPYFISDLRTRAYTKIYVLKERAAFELYLYAGDIRKMGFNKALARRYDQINTKTQTT